MSARTPRHRGETTPSQRKDEREFVLAVIVVGFGALIRYTVALYRPGGLIGTVIGLAIGLGLLWWRTRRQRNRRERKGP